MCGVYVRVCISMQDYIGGCGGIHPQEILEIRCSEIASEAISRCRYQGDFGGFSSPRFRDLWDLGIMEYENQMYLCIDALH